MLVTVAVNLCVIVYEGRAARRLASEVLMADVLQTRGDVWTSLTVIAALAGARSGLPILDPIAALVVAAFIGYSGYQVARRHHGNPERSDRDCRRRPRARRAERTGRARLPSDPDARGPRITSSSTCTSGCPPTCAWLMLTICRTWSRIA